MSRNDTFVSLFIMDEDGNQVIKENLEKDVAIEFRLNENEIQ